MKRWNPLEENVNFEPSKEGEWIIYSDHQAALFHIRSLLEAKAKEWARLASDHSDGAQGQANLEMCSAELLALAATLGNQGK